MILSRRSFLKVAGLSAVAHKKALQYTDHPFRDFADRMFSGRIFLSLFQKKYGSDLFPILK